MLIFNGDIFLGMITNGDLQRAIIANKPFNTPISELIDNTNKKYAHKGDDIQQIKDWMRDVRAEYMPVLDSEGKLTDVIFWDDVLSDFVVLARVRLSGQKIGLVALKLFDFPAKRVVPL